MLTLRDVLMLWTGMVIYRIIHEFYRLREKAYNRGRRH